MAPSPESFASIIIPAHNEAATIVSTVQSLLDDPRREALDVVVVCNGCTDDTAALAAALGAPVRVIESPIASKAAALELGRQSTADGPRIYVDADVTVTPGTVSAIVSQLARPGIEAASVVRGFRSDGATWPMRKYLEISSYAPYFSDNLVGAGLFGVTAAGSDSLGAFPDIIADDLFVGTHFPADARAVAADATFQPLLSKRLRDLLQIETRCQAGRVQFVEWAERNNIAVHDQAEGLSWVPKLAKRPSNWPGLAVFIYAKLAVRARYLWRRRRGTATSWTRDQQARDQAQRDASVR